MCVCVATTQSDSGGKFSIWGGDCIGHGKRKSSYARVSDSEYQVELFESTNTNVLWVAIKTER